MDRGIEERYQEVESRWSDETRKKERERGRRRERERGEKKKGQLNRTEVERRK